MNTQNRIIVVIGLVAILAATGVGGAVLFATPDTVSLSSSPTTLSSAASTTKSATPSVSSAQSSIPNTPSSAPTTDYKDGTYTANSSYRVPRGGTNDISTTIVVSGGVIASVKTSNVYTDHESSMYIESFDSSVGSNAEGKRLSSYNPSRIGGASLTTSAFINTLDTIRSQAS